MKTKMTREALKNWTLSSYNEDTDDQLDYYLNESCCEVCDKAYLYDHGEDDLTEMEILHIIRRSDDLEAYDEMIEDDDVLIDGEDEYDADTGAEFISDNDCYLVWFKYLEAVEDVTAKVGCNMKRALIITEINKGVIYSGSLDRDTFDEMMSEFKNIPNDNKLRWVMSFLEDKGFHVYDVIYNTKHDDTSSVMYV